MIEELGDSGILARECHLALNFAPVVMLERLRVSGQHYLVEQLGGHSCTTPANVIGNLKEQRAFNGLLRSYSSDQL